MKSTYLDLAAVAVLALAAAFAALLDLPVAVVLGPPFVLLAPGYAVASAVFPGQGVDWVERVVAGFFLSLAAVVLVVAVLEFTPLGFTRTALLVSLAAVTVAGVVAAALRRRGLRPQQRYRVSAGVPGEGLSAVLLNLGVAAVVVVVLAAAVYGSASMDSGFTEFYVVTEGEDGFVMDGYPEAVDDGGVYVGIGNHEGVETRYSVVVLAGGGGEQRVVDGFNVTVPPGENVTTRHDVSGLSGGAGDGGMRVTYLLYRGDPPDSPGVDSAYREVHFWLAGAP